jgi:hypothetical protein
MSAPRQPAFAQEDRSGWPRYSNGLNSGGMGKVVAYFMRDEANGVTEFNQALR